MVPETRKFSSSPSFSPRITPFLPLLDPNLTHHPGVPNACTFVIKKEDHTLGNLLRDRLLLMPSVLFSAYKTPHPLFAEFELRVQTDGSITPKNALMKACGETVRDLDQLSREFTKEFELKKLSRGVEGDGGMNGNGDGYNGY